MSPGTHFLASWIVAAKTTNNPRDLRLVTLAGVLPDLDGLGLLMDVVNKSWGHRPTVFYEQYHHYLLHGVLGGFLIAAVLAGFARQRWRVLWIALLLFHLHLFCDFVGSRGPSAEDLWPIFYLGPLDREPMWFWKGQWRLDGWQNQTVSVVLLGWALWLATGLGHSFIGVFNRRLDEVFVGVLRQWRQAWLKAGKT